MNGQMDRTAMAICTVAVPVLSQKPIAVPVHAKLIYKYQIL